MTITLYPSRTIERYFGSAWDDISAYVVGDISFDIGMASGDYDDRLGKVGSFSFVINNASSHFNADTDFPGKMKIRVTLDAGHSVTKTLICYVRDTDPPSNFEGEEGKFIRVHGTCYFGLAYLNLLRAVAVQQNKTIDEAATVLLAEMPIQPTGTNFDTGSQTFPFVFDIVKTKKTTLYSELNHLNLSELGYCYMTCGDILTIENYTSRNSPTLPTYTYYYPTEDGTELWASPSGGQLLTSDGAGLLVSKVSSGTFDSTFTKVIRAEVVQGKNIINEVSFTVNPRKVDLSVGSKEQIYTYNLYTTNPAIPIANGATLKLRGGYWDEYPSHKSKIDAAMDVNAPAIGAMGDSVFTISPSGTTGMTFTWKGGGDSWEWTIVNNSGVTKSITYMEFYGRPISNQQPIEYSVEDTDSQEAYGKSSVFIDQSYKDTLDIATVQAPALLGLEKDPRTEVRSVDLIANIDEHEMLGFIYTDIGDYRRITLTNPVKDSYYFVQGMKGTISPSGLIKYTLRLMEKLDFDVAIYNDDHARMIYTGSWSDWQGSGSAAYNDDLHYLANGQGGYVEFSFTGNHVKYLYTKMNDRGSVEIYIDNVLVDTVNQYNVTQIFQSVWDSGSLVRGAHTIKISKVGTSNVVDIDAIQVVS